MAWLYNFDSHREATQGVALPLGIATEPVLQLEGEKYGKRRQRQNGGKAPVQPGFSALSTSGQPQMARCIEIDQPKQHDQPIVAVTLLEKNQAPAHIGRKRDAATNHRGRQMPLRECFRTHANHRTLFHPSP